MATFHCVHCGMPFDQRRNEELCPTCDANSEVVFRYIKEYLYEHPGASATELVNNLGVTLKQIRHYLREERLEVVGDGYTGLKCDMCGRAIQTGRLCEFCAKDVQFAKNADVTKAAQLGRKDEAGARGKADGALGKSKERGRSISYRNKP